MWVEERIHSHCKVRRTGVETQALLCHHHPIRRKNIFCSRVPITFLYLWLPYWSLCLLVWSMRGNRWEFLFYLTQVHTQFYFFSGSVRNVVNKVSFFLIEGRMPFKTVLITCLNWSRALQNMKWWNYSFLKSGLNVMMCTSQGAFM